MSGPAWDVVGWVAYLVAAGATLLRRRLPRTTLAVVLPIAVAALCLRASGGTVFYVVLALYSLVAVSSRRAALAAASLSAARGPGRRPRRWRPDRWSRPASAASR